MRLNQDRKDDEINMNLAPLDPAVLTMPSASIASII
jgi:hypothetical protein